MALTREEKTQLIQDMIDKLENARSVIFTEYRGMTMKDLTDLRNKLREIGVDYKISKNTLMRIALKKVKISVPDEILDLPVAVAFGMDDEVAPAKAIVTSAKELEALKVVGGIINKEYTDGASVKRLAALPGREELYGKLVGTISAPMYGLVGVLSGNMRGLVSVLKQYQAKISE